ncbi:MAG: substrate-binding domain-containing protein, partial [Chthoniobacteraceae bacterium]
MKLRAALVILSLTLSVIIGFVIARGRTSERGPVANARPLIGLSMDTLKEERWIGDRDMFVKRAKELGADVLVQSANSDDTGQISDIESLISRGVDALVIIPHDGAA